MAVVEEPDGFVVSATGMGFQGVAIPVTRSTAASPPRGWPPIVLKMPPTNRRPPEGLIVLTVTVGQPNPRIGIGCIGLGFHAVAFPESASTAASAGRTWPPIV